MGNLRLELNTPKNILVFNEGNNPLIPLKLECLPQTQRGHRQFWDKPSVSLWDLHSIMIQMDKSLCHRSSALYGLPEAFPS